MAWNETPPGLERVTGQDFSADQRYQQSETLFCPGDGFLIMDATIPLAILTSLDATDSYAADHISALAAYDLVQIYTLGASAGGGANGGYHNCTEYRNHDPMTSADYTSVTVTGGPSTELRAAADGALRPILNPTQANWTPLSDGLFMRPTALWWDGQDPSYSDANRSVWLPSEVIGVLGAIALHHSFVEAAGYDVYFGTGVRALNVIYGSPYTSPQDPVICFV